MPANENDRAEFLARILAEPDDDFHRLVYADFLEEAEEIPRAEDVRGRR